MRDKFYGQPFSSERDGYSWLQGLEYSKDHDQEYYNKWKTNLAIAEITGFYTYAAVVKTLKEQPQERWQGYNLKHIIEHAQKIGAQEYAHYNIVSARLNIEVLPVEHEATFAELDLNERRSDMRLTTIIASSSDQDLVSLASRLIVDEAYHCWFCKLVLKELGDFPIMRLT